MFYVCMYVFMHVYYVCMYVYIQSWKWVLEYNLKHITGSCK